MPRSSRPRWRGSARSHVEVTFYAATSPEGREVAPTFDVGDHEFSIEQARALAETPKAVVETYRAAGGIA
ncbi:MAG TPA: hypothetical protein VFF32_16110 [Dermatophilaceae bacterium]|nr:hypothetical protein [Dermatophilaceae bacterium]